MDGTTNHNLKKWDAGDRVLRTDFNDTLDKIDAALPNWKMYTYTGTGTCGKNNPSSLTFPARPVMVLLFGEYYMAAVPGFREKFTSNLLSDSSSGYSTFSWSGNTLSWYTFSSSASYQFNTTGTTYHCLAIFGPEVPAAG